MSVACLRGRKAESFGVGEDGWARAAHPQQRLLRDLTSSGEAERESEGRWRGCPQARLPSWRRHKTADCGKPNAP